MLVGIVSVVIFGTGIGAGRAQEEQTLNKNPPTYDHISLANMVLLAILLRTAISLT